MATPLAGMLLCLPALAALAACARGRPADVTAGVLDLADIRVADAGRWREKLPGPDAPAERAQAARALGRVRAPGLVPLLVEALGREPDAGARLEIVFALGQTCGEDAARAVRPLLDDPAPALRARAAEAVGKCGGTEDVESLLASLSDPIPEVRAASLLALTRLRGRRATPPDALAETTVAALLQRLEALLENADEGVRWRAAHALAEIEVPGRDRLLERAARAAEEYSRLFAVRALGRLGPREGGRIALLLSILATDPSPHVAAAAAEALGRARGPAAASAAAPLLEAARRTARPTDHHLRRAAFTALGELGEAIPPEIGRAVAGAGGSLQDSLRHGLEDPSGAVRTEALIALARLLPASAQPEIAARARSPRLPSRRDAARAAGHLEWTAARDLLLDLAADPEPPVAAEALDALARFETKDPARRQAALAALDSPDLAVRAGAIALVRRCGTAGDLARLASIYEASTGTEWTEVRVSIIEAAAVLAGRDAVALLERARRDDAAAVRTASERELAALASASGGGAKPPAGALPGPAAAPEEPPSSVPLRAGTDFGSSAPNPRALLKTDKGDIVLELLREEAPRHVRSFVDLARRGFYDGLAFHRVVPGFVIQGLDPRGDGWGTGGVFLRDEINPLPFLAGTVGMPNAGPDTGGCQIFITHVPTPHLDGRYTVFARVAEGMDVVGAIDVGDICRRVEIRATGGGL